jgi:hypothetical protein
VASDDQVLVGHWKYQLHVAGIVPHIEGKRHPMLGSGQGSQNLLYDANIGVFRSVETP